MKTQLNRRGFLKGTAMAGGALFAGRPMNSFASRFAHNHNRLKISLNAYSFNTPLSKGSMTIDNMLEFCAENGFFACDITAYYFPGYPEVPSDDYLYHIKHKAFRLGLEISGTGVRNDFTLSDPITRSEHNELIKKWIVAAEKMGAPVIRVFAGPKPENEFERPALLKRMISDIRDCVAFGKAHGVMVAVQNHHDFIQSPEHAKELVEGVNSDWFGLILDTGGYRSGDPYQQIAESIKYAVNWQVKETVFVNGEEVAVDMTKLVEVIKNSNYRGYLPIETLGKGDPKKKVLNLYTALQQALN